MLVLPADYFRAFHLQHHRFTQDRRRDPELAAPPLAGRRAYLWHVSGIPYWRDRFAATGRHALGRVTEDFVPAALRPAIVRDARTPLAGYALPAPPLARKAVASGMCRSTWLVLGGLRIHTKKRTTH